MSDNGAGVRLMAETGITFGVRLDRDIVQALEARARKLGITRNEALAEILRAALAPAITLEEIKEEALAEADRAVRDRLSVVETAIKQVQDRVNAIESTMKDVQDELLALETNTELDPIERARKRAALKQDLAVLQEGLGAERAALEDLRGQRQALLAERAEAFAQALRPRLEEWLGHEGGRIVGALSGLLSGWLSALDTCLYLRTPADRARAVRFLWYGLLSELARTATDVGIQSWARQMMPLAAWDWGKTVSLTFADFPVRQHGEVVHALHDGHGGEEGGHEEGY